MSIYSRKISFLDVANLYFLSLWLILIYLKLNQLLTDNIGDLHNYYYIYEKNDLEVFSGYLFFNYYISASNVIYSAFGVEGLIFRDLLIILLISYCLGDILKIKTWPISVFFITLISSNTILHIISTQRQFLSILILLIAIILYKNRSKINIIFFAIAALLHLSSLLYLIFYYFWHFLISKKKYALMLIILPILIIGYLFNFSFEFYFAIFDRLDHYTDPDNMDVGNYFFKIFYSFCVSLLCFLGYKNNLKFAPFKSIFLLNLFSLIWLIIIPSIGDRFFQLSFFISLFVALDLFNLAFRSKRAGLKSEVHHLLD